MAKLCFSSVVTANHFQYYIPLFVYSTCKAYPDDGVQIFLTGKLKQSTKDALKLVPHNNWEVKEKWFTDYPNQPSMCNSLRFLIPRKEYDGFDYIFVRDIDFVMFRSEPTHLDYLVKRMKNSPYYGVRGPYNYPRRPKINYIGWKQDYTRIAGGTFLMKNPDWFNATDRVTKAYLKRLKYGEADGIDAHSPASYREYDEVMLYRICKHSGLKTPRIKNKDVYGHHISNVYRDVHLGDFNKAHRGMSKLKRVLADKTVKKYLELEEDSVWQAIKEIVSKNGKIAKVLRRARMHMDSRSSSL